MGKSETWDQFGVDGHGIRRPNKESTPGPPSRTWLPPMLPVPQVRGPQEDKYGGLPQVWLLKLSRLDHQLHLLLRLTPRQHKTQAMAFVGISLDHVRGKTLQPHLELLLLSGKPKQPYLLDTLLTMLKAFAMYGYDAGVLGGVQTTEPFLKAMGVSRDFSPLLLL